jgi:hypothetical protein
VPNSPFLPLFSDCQFQRLDFVQFLYFRQAGVLKLDFSHSTCILCYFCSVLLERPLLSLYNSLAQNPTSRQRARPHRQDCNLLKLKINKQIAGHMPQMRYDTKTTDRLTDCQSQCDFDFDHGKHCLVLLRNLVYSSVT